MPTTAGKERKKARFDAVSEGHHSAACSGFLDNDKWNIKGIYHPVITLWPVQTLTGEVNLVSMALELHLSAVNILSVKLTSEAQNHKDCVNLTRVTLESGGQRISKSAVLWPGPDQTVYHPRKS